MSVTVQVKLLLAAVRLDSVFVCDMRLYVCVLIAPSGGIMAPNASEDKKDLQRFTSRSSSVNILITAVM